MAVVNSFHCSNTENSKPIIWAIIPARGGSKRLPRKNIMPFAGGLSLTARKVSVALAAEVFSKVLVSTDDPNIAEDGRSAGAIVPFIRPANLADDTASSVDVLCHAVREMRQLNPGECPLAFCLLQVTSPMLSARHVGEAVKLFLAGGFNSLSSMTKVKQYPEWMFRVADSGTAIPDDAKGIVTASAGIPGRFIENGAIYLVKADWLERNQSLYDFSNHGCYVMSCEDSIDIDTRADWDYAEFMLGYRSRQA